MTRQTAANSDVADPLVTIITGVHNSAPFVQRCIESVLAQTYRRWEQVIVDDGSTDNTAELVARYSDPRIRFIQLRHRGVTALAETYNAALALAGGEVVAVLEGDDFWPANKLALQLPTFRAPSIQLSWGNAIVVDTNDRPLWSWPGARSTDTEIPLDKLFRELTCTNILTPTVTVMARRSALIAVGGFQQPAGALFVDLPTWLKIAANVEGKARRLGRLLGYYRMHPTQISTTNYHAYHTAQSGVVAAIVSECSPETLQKVGWTRRAQRRSRARAELAAGVALLRQGKRRDARRALLTSLTHPDSARSVVRAGLGLLSSFVAIDLVGYADAARRVVGAVALRLSR
ncbi:MAG TPA: glycosyltransferase [Gemmatimonadaceae bacterium]